MLDKLTCQITSAKGEAAMGQSSQIEKVEAARWWSLPPAEPPFALHNSCGLCQSDTKAIVRAKSCAVNEGLLVPINRKSVRCKKVTKPRSGYRLNSIKILYLHTLNTQIHTNIYKYSISHIMTMMLMAVFVGGDQKKGGRRRRRKRASFKWTNVTILIAVGWQLFVGKHTTVGIYRLENSCRDDVDVGRNRELHFSYGT